MILREIAAREKGCPFARNSEEIVYCAGSKCMAWQTVKHRGGKCMLIPHEDGPRKRMAKISRAQIWRMRHDSKMSVRAICDELDCSDYAVRRALKEYHPPRQDFEQKSD